MSTHLPIQWPANTGAAAAAAHQAAEERDNDSNTSSDVEPIASPAKRNRGTVVAGARQGRDAAQPVARASEPVPQSADNVTTPKGLAKGVNIALGITKERTQHKAIEAELRHKLSAQAAASKLIIDDKSRSLTAAHAQLREKDRDIADLRRKVAEEGQRAFDEGYKQGIRVRPLQPAPPLVPLQPAHSAAPYAPPVHSAAPYQAIAPPAPVPAAAEIQPLLTQLFASAFNAFASAPDSPYRRARAGKAKQQKKGQAPAQPKSD